MRSYKIPSPFTYNPIAPADGEKKGNELGVTWPMPANKPQEVIKDVNRDMGRYKVGDKTLLDFRMEDMEEIKSSPLLKKIATLTDSDISSMGEKKMSEIKNGMLTEISEDDAKKLLKTWTESIFNIIDKSQNPDNPDSLYPETTDQHLVKLTLAAEMIVIDAESISPNALKHTIMNVYDKILHSEIAPALKNKLINELLINSRALIIAKTHFALTAEGLTEFKAFLMEHVLSNVEDQEKREFLANTVACSFHQSGIPVATSTYFQEKLAGEVMKEMSQKRQERELTVQSLVEAPRLTHISCDKDGKITFDTTVSFCKVVRMIGGKSPDDRTLRQSDASFATVQSKIYIEAKESKAPEGFELKLTGEDLVIQKKPIAAKDNTGKIHVANYINTFISKVLDDPLSGNNGIVFQQGKPILAECKPMVTYLYFEGNSLKYMAKDHEGNPLEGTIPTKNLAQRKGVITSIETAQSDDRNLSDRIADAKDNKNPLFIKEGDNYIIYGCQDGFWKKTRLSSLKTEEKALLDKIFSTNKTPDTKDVTSLIELSKKGHTPSKMKSGSQTLESLKKICPSRPTTLRGLDADEAMTDDKRGALLALFKAASSIEYHPTKSFTEKFRGFFKSLRHGESKNIKKTSTRHQPSTTAKSEPPRHQP